MRVPIRGWGRAKYFRQYESTERLSGQRLPSLNAHRSSKIFANLFAFAESKALNWPSIRCFTRVMKQALQLKLGQQLTLTPQLQQAIKLLQLSTLDLQQTITETLASVSVMVCWRSRVLS